MRLAWAAMFVVGCKYQIDQPPLDAQFGCSMESTATVCTQEAAALTDCSQPTSGCFKFIKEKIFDKNCNTASCHDKMGAGKLELASDGGSVITQDTAYANLVGTPGTGITSDVNMKFKLVVPMHPEQSYLALMVQGVMPGMMDPATTDPPSTVGYMPKGTANLFCCQKTDVIMRWIQGGALNN